MALLPGADAVEPGLALAGAQVAGASVGKEVKPKIAAGDTKPKWDNAISQNGGDFGALNQNPKVAVGGAINLQLRLAPEMELKILSGQRVANTNKMFGGALRA